MSVKSLALTCLCIICISSIKAQDTTRHENLTDSLPKAQWINEVDILAKNPLFKQEGDKWVVQAASISPGAAATLVELLERCPTLWVDSRSYTISMKGRNGVMLMVDGRLQMMNGEELFNWMRGISAAMVDKIELISHPSARFDASGSAGLINIVLKREKKKGYGLTSTSSVGQGRYGKWSQGLNAFWRKNKWSINGQYQFSNRKGFNQLYLQRDFFQGDTFASAYNQRNYLRFPFKNHQSRWSFDYYQSSKINVGFTINGNINHYQPNGKNYSMVLNENRLPVGYFTTTNSTKNALINGSINAYIKYKLDTLGSEWNLDVENAQFGSQSKQNFITSYFDASWQKSQNDDQLKGDLEGILKITALKTDWVKKLANNVQWEAGGKFSLVNANNHVKFSNIFHGVEILDSGKSNHFLYKEQILAGYIQFSKRFNQWSAMAGIRAEQTFANGNQLYTQQVFERNYIQWFPSINIQYQSEKGHMHGAIVSRRINRPTYQQLNPFKFYLDPTTYREGNPWLNPELTWSIEIQEIRKTGINYTLSLNQTQRIITEVIYPAEENAKITIQTNKNLRNFSSVILGLSGPINGFKNSQGMFSMNAGYQNFTGNLANTPLNKGSIAINASFNYAWSLNKYLGIDINGMYQSSQLYGYLWVKQLGQFGVGASYQFPNKKGNLRLTANDIFFTANPRGETAFVGYEESFVVKRETRVVMLTFQYKIGSQNTMQRPRRGGAEEEKNRAQGGLG